MDPKKFVETYLNNIRNEVLKQINECFTETGCIKNEHKYRHALMAQKLDALDEVIEFVK